MIILSSIDWLALSFNGTISSSGCFQFEQKPYGCKQFHSLYDVYYHGMLVGLAQADPCLTAIDRDLIIFKFENSILYSHLLQELIRALKIDLGWTFHGISRVDICGDFLRFNNGQNPSEFIRDFMAGKVDSLSKMKAQTVRSKAQTIQYEYLSFGSRYSGIRTYLYNKSKEQRDVKIKPWICDLHNDVFGVDHEDVWRLEFSLKSDSLVFEDKDTKEAVKIDLESLLNDEKRYELFTRLSCKYFAFIHSSSDKNRYRKERIDLLGSPQYRTKRLVIHCRKDINRADRIFIKKACNVINTCSKIGEPERLLMARFIRNYAAIGGLTKWANEKELSIRVNPLGMPLNLMDMPPLVRASLKD